MCLITTFNTYISMFFLHLYLKTDITKVKPIKGFIVFNFPDTTFHKVFTQTNEV